MATVYRLYTEDLSRTKITEIVSEYFDGFSLINARGVWHGVAESSLIIEIVADDFEDEAIRDIAERIRHYNGQQAVMITSFVVNATLVTEDGCSALFPNPQEER